MHECFVVVVAVVDFLQFCALKSGNFDQNLQGLKLRNNSHTFRHLEMHPNGILGQFGKCLGYPVYNQSEAISAADCETTKVAWQ